MDRLACIKLDVPADLIAGLYRFSPRIAVSERTASVWWLDASGLQSLYASLVDWAEEIADYVAQQTQRKPYIVVGFSQFATYAIACHRSDVLERSMVVFQTPAQEETYLYRVLLSSIFLARSGHCARHLPEKVAVENLLRLGIATVGEFVQLPEAGILERFGVEVYQLHRLATGAAQLPFIPCAEVLTVSRQIEVDDEAIDLSRTLFDIKRALDQMMVILQAHNKVLFALQLKLRLRDKTEPSYRISPAEPTRDVPQLIDLVRLKIGALALDSPIERIDLTAEHVDSCRKQIGLFTTQPAGRNMDAFNRALARLHAELGPMAVVRAVLKSQHLPESTFQWEPVFRVTLSRTMVDQSRPAQLVRRLWTRPIPLPPIVAPQTPTALDVHSGGWWQASVFRDYYYCQLDRPDNGALHWVYYDRLRRIWLLHGIVD